MGEPFRSNIELISFNSASKGMFGHCGLRGGYFEAINLSPKSKEIFYKLKSIELCSNTIGQMAVQMMVDPPKEGRESDETV